MLIDAALSLLVNVMYLEKGQYTNPVCSVINTVY